jgi:hypothetical protein
MVYAFAAGGKMGNKSEKIQEVAIIILSAIAWLLLVGVVALPTVLPVIRFKLNAAPSMTEMLKLDSTSAGSTHDLAFSPDGNKSRLQRHDNFMGCVQPEQNTNFEWIFVQKRSIFSKGQINSCQLFVWTSRSSESVQVAGSISIALTF